jgi:predicted PurR-regulated permease PerM
MVRLLHSWHVPEAIGAAVVLVIALGGAATAVVSVYEPAMEWAKRAPGTLHRVEIKLRELRKPVDDVGRAAEQVEKITKMDEEEVPSVQIQGEGVNSRLLKYTVGTIGSVVVMIFLLYFVLATGGQFLHKLSALLARKTKHGGDPSLVAETEQHVSRYLFTVATINVGLGVVIALVMWALGMPNPLLWGLIATVLNFIPYLGAVTGVAVTAVVAIVTFDDSRCITVPLAYAACTSLEGMLITPMILGRRFKLDPVVVFLWLVFWGWLWGIGGALLAMPMLVILRIASEKIPTLSPVADVLGVSRPRQSVQPH